MNSAQLQAVMHGEGPMLVLAGPGSGKTTVIVNRILYLINERQIPPENILVVTFTRDAALSMQNRFAKEAGAVVPVNFGTFHSVFYHILLKSYEGRSVPALITQSQKKQILTTILKDKIQNKGTYYDMDAIKEDAENFLGAIGFYKNTGDESAALKKLSEGWRGEFKSIFQEFRRRMRKQGGVDFDDMVYECRELLLRDKECLIYWQERFQYLLVDEFQDINPLQYEVLKLLSKKHQNLFVVGDDDQAIYGFRGSKPACLRQFTEEFGAARVTLGANYRSSQAIVEASGKVIGENRDRFAKECYAAGVCKDASDSINIRVFQNSTEELAWIKAELSKATNEETCAVLFRTNTKMQQLASVLKRENVPFVMRGQTGNPYDHFIARDIMSYLRFAKGEHSRAFFLRIMNRPVRYLDREAVGESETVDLGRIRLNYAKRGRPGDIAAMQALDALNQQLTALKAMSPGPAVIYLCKGVGYEAYLRKKAGNREQLEEWMELLEFFRQEAAAYGNLEEWLNAQRQLRDGGQECLLQGGGKGRKLQDEKNKDGVKEANIHLMTVHASKGLEFDRVIIPDCNEKTFPHGNMPDCETVEEERRLFYVGMTRAKKHLELLCLSGSKERPRVMSRFLNPIVKDYPPKNVI